MGGFAYLIDQGNKLHYEVDVFLKQKRNDSVKDM